MSFEGWFKHRSCENCSKEYIFSGAIIVFWIIFWMIWNLDEKKKNWLLVVFL